MTDSPMSQQAPSGRTFGQSLRAHRLLKGRTLRGLAQKVGISQAYLSDIELSRRQPPPLPMVKKIADALDIDASGLIDRARRERNDAGYVAEMVAENERLRGLLRRLIDRDPCRFDHEGYCQTHGVSRPCAVAEAWAVLDDTAQA